MAKLQKYASILFAITWLVLVVATASQAASVSQWIATAIFGLVAFSAITRTIKGAFQ